MLEHIVPVLSTIFSLENIVFLLLGALLGMIFGLLPGLGGAQALALLIPISIGFDMIPAILLMVGAMGSATTAGSITSILLNTPGTPGSTSTTFDGYPLTQKGKAGMAIGAAASSSLLGGIVGLVVLIAILPFGKYIVLAFSFPEYFMLGVLSLSVISMITEGTMWKGLISALFGLMVASIGYDPVTGDLRYTFDIIHLYDGISLVSVVVGLFAITEILELMSKKNVKKVESKESIKGIGEGILSVFKNFGLFFRCSIIGTIIGILPGVGGSVANFLAYGHAVQTSKNPENFGKGDIRGVIAPEASNNAKDSGSFVPTLIFGIPGSVDTAVLLGALIIHGVQPGPLLMSKSPDIIVLLIITLLLANVLMCSITVLLAHPLSKIATINKSIILPIIGVFALLGTYVFNGRVIDVWLALLFGLIGFIMKRADFSRVSFVIAFVLSDLIQQNFHLTLRSFGLEGFVARPISLTLFLLTLILLAAPYLKNKWRRG
ncbi:tripartite tricarboxylate transporter permease [Bacillus sp. Marseille-P3661]|uniref:tripartite tricarboxylate transporter permease n=1 Tax=Bacillus sp. Marseille-P3661 TaxID=1936234 RepID=UPI002155BA05|nr:tripartite tricarboxylate transporter permease [Bacillus sp. Marseille-P3661]